MPKSYEDMTLSELAAEYNRLKKVLAKQDEKTRPKAYSITVSRMAHLHRLYKEKK